ncbi:MAG: hypothetical protein SPH83_07705 [Treponema sp.]|nr:hypothetical protein [Spirochaetales bacterium]MDY6190366.1 hypothetical protein [Treponema sp.]
MKKISVLFFCFLMILLSSCGLNSPELSNVSLTIPFDIVNKIYRATNETEEETTVTPEESDVLPQSFELICTLEGKGINTLQKKVTMRKNEDVNIFFEDLPAGKEAKISARIEIKKWVTVGTEEKFLDRYEANGDVFIKQGENSVSLKLTKVYTDVSVDFPLLTSESFVSILIRNSKTGEWEDHTPTSPSDTITIDSSTEVLKIKLPEALNGKKWNLYLNDNVRIFYNCYYDINLNQDEDVVFTEIEKEKINQCTFTVEMDSLPLKKTYIIVKK